MDDTPQGPGLTKKEGAIDGVSTTSIVFALIGLIPAKFIGIGGYHAFGPIAFTAIFAIVGVLFGFLAVFRHGELQDPTALRVGIAGAALGLLRLFIYPFFGL